MSLQITQIDHVSVLVTDLAKCRHFYRDVLGLKEIAKPKTFDFKVLWFELGNQQLHFLQKPQPDTRSPRHFALRVTDVRAAREHFHRHGIETQTTPKPLPRFDPDGNRLRLFSG
jgi:catechol 2,3-dioxygenase-like lactoylglutathione lyase family enzyme